MATAVGDQPAWEWMFAVVVAGVLVIWFLWVVRLIREGRRRWREWQDRPPVSDEDFLTACGVTPDHTDAPTLLAVRRVLEQVGGVSPQKIRANDPMIDRFWDSLDQLDIVFRIEREMNVKLPRPFFETAAELARRDGTGLQVRHLARAAPLHAIRITPHQTSRTIARGRPRT